MISVGYAMGNHSEYQAFPYVAEYGVCASP